ALPVPECAGPARGPDCRARPAGLLRRAQTGQSALGVVSRCIAALSGAGRSQRNTDCLASSRLCWGWLDEAHELRFDLDPGSVQVKCRDPHAVALEDIGLIHIHSCCWIEKNAFGSAVT